MPATVTLRLNDQASPALEDFQHALEGTGLVSEKAAAGVTQLTEAQVQQISVIHEHRGAWLQFAGNALYAAATFTQVAGKVQQTAMWTGTLRDMFTKGAASAKSMGGSLTGLAARGGAATATLSRLALVTGGVGLTLGAVALGTVAVGTAVVRMNERLKQSSTATETQRERFQQLKLEANALRISIEDAASRSGIELGTLAVTTETSFLRIKTAADELSLSVIRSVSDLAIAYRDVGLELIGINSAWKGVETQVEKSTKLAVGNLQAIQKVVDAWADFRLGEGYSERARQQAKWNESLEETHANFQRLRTSNAVLKKETEALGQAREIAALKTTKAIDQELYKEREKAGHLAAARQFDEQAQQAYHERMAALERRRTQILDEQTRERVRLEKERLAESVKAEQAAMNARLAIAEKAYKDFQALMANRVAGERDLQFTANREILNDTIAALEREGADADTLHYAKMQALEQERNQRIAAADSQLEREKILFDYEQRRLIEAGNFRRSQLKQQLDDEKAAAEQRLQIQKEAQDRAKQVLEGAGMTGENILANQDPRKALAALQARRRQAALDEFNNSDRGKELSNAANFDSRANRRLQHEQRKVAKEAEMQAFRDARMGNLNPGEQQQAQLDAANQQINAMAKTGQYSQDVLRALAETVRTAAQHEATMQSLQQQVEQLNNQSRATGRAASQTRQRAQKGSL